MHASEPEKATFEGLRAQGFDLYGVVVIELHCLFELRAAAPSEPQLVTSIPAMGESIAALRKLSPCRRRFDSPRA